MPDSVSSVVLIRVPFLGLAGIRMRRQELRSSRLGFSDNEAEALARAEDVLISAIEFYLEDKHPIPASSKPRKHEPLVSVPASITNRVLLLNEMLPQGIGPWKLARRMRTIPQNVTRLIDLRHRSKLESVEHAITAPSKQL